MKILFFTAFIFLITKNGFAGSQDGGNEFRLDFNQTREGYQVLEFELDDYSQTPFVVEGFKASKITVKGLSNYGAKGEPFLPKLRKNLMVPFHSDVRVELVDVVAEKVSGITPLPSKGDLMRNQSPEEVSYVFSSLYNSDQSFDIDSVLFAKIKEHFQLRNSRGINLEISPFHYSPADNSLIVLRKATIKLHHGQMGQQMLRTSRGLDPMMSLYKHVYFNGPRYMSPSMIEKRKVDASMLIISSSDFSEQTQQFTEDKELRGYSVHHVVAPEEHDYLDIKQIISRRYQDDPSLLYVVLVGDAEHLAFHPGESGNASGNEADPMYGLLEGDDSYPELVIARMSAQNELDLSKIFSRSLEYESLSGSWLYKASGIASDEGSPTDSERADMLKAMLKEDVYSAVDRHYDPGVKKRDVFSSLNSGRSLVNYIGHGSSTAWVTSGFSVSDISRLENYGKLPVIVSVACVNGDFDYPYGDSFAEAWLKAGDGLNAAGAIVVFASSTNQSWVPPTVGQHKISELVSNRSNLSIGEMLVQGSIAVLEDGDYTAEQTFETWHIFGDPSLKFQH